MEQLSLRVSYLQYVLCNFLEQFTHTSTTELLNLYILSTTKVKSLTFG